MVYLRRARIFLRAFRATRQNPKIRRFRTPENPSRGRLHHHLQEGRGIFRLGYLGAQVRTVRIARRIRQNGRCRRPRRRKKTRRQHNGIRRRRQKNRQYLRNRDVAGNGVVEPLRTHGSAIQIYRRQKIPRLFRMDSLLLGKGQPQTGSRLKSPRRNLCR